MSNSTKIIVNNKLVDISKQPIAFALQSASEIFKTEQSMNRTKTDGSLTQLSENVLHVMGVTMITSAAGGEDIPFTADFSFKSTKNSDAGIDNVNIIDPDIDTLTPELTTAKDNFLAVNDPFYEQDEAKTEKHKNELRTKLKTIKKPLILIARDMCQPHLSHQINNQSRYFINRNTSSRRGRR